MIVWRISIPDRTKTGIKSRWGAESEPAQRAVRSPSSNPPHPLLRPSPPHADFAAESDCRLPHEPHRPAQLLRGGEAHLEQQTDSLHPAKALLHSLGLPLAQGVARLMLNIGVANLPLSGHHNGFPPTGNILSTGTECKPTIGCGACRVLKRPMESRFSSSVGA